MFSVEREKDIEVLRQAARLLEAENRQLHLRIAQVLSELNKLKGKDSKGLQLELSKLQRQLEQRNQKLFAASSSERREVAPAKAEPKKPQVGHGRRAQPALPSIERIWALGEAEQRCPKCGAQLEEMKGEFEKAEEITVISRRFELVKHKQQEYRCRCNECVITAPGPLKLFPGARYSIDFAIDVACEKYLDHQPLERQCRKMSTRSANRV